MTATTHTEIYRRFRGSLRSGFLRFLPITATGIRVATRRKIPMLLLFSPPAIATVIFSFTVYSKYLAISEALESASLRDQMMAKFVGQLIEVREEIVTFNTSVRGFSLLAIAWYGAGLLAEDRRVGAHQLYFARPIRRFDYVAGKFLVAAFFGALATLVPGLIICSIAAFASPDWAFVKDEWDVILKTVLYSVLWIFSMASLTLALSSLVDRRSFALAGIFAFLMLTQAFGFSLMEVYRDDRYPMIGLLVAFQAIADRMFDVRHEGFQDAAGTAWICASVTTFLSLAIVTWRVRRLEVVA